METPCSLVDGRGNLYNFDLEESDIWLPYSYRNELLKSVLLYMSTLTAMLFLVMSIFIIKGRSSKSEKEIKTVFKDSAQIINIIFNLIISSMGCYYWFAKVPNDNTYDLKVIGCERLSFATNFGVLQFSYQIWSIVISIMCEDPPIMLLHHIMVATCAFFSSTLVTGFRYCTIFFFGVCESSSVPLIIMNTLRDKPKIRESLPGLVNNLVKVIFSVSFLFTRVWLWIPQIYDFLVTASYTAQQGAILNPSKSLTWKLLLLSTYPPALGLTFLQLFWGYKIVVGLIRLFGGVKKDNDKKE